mmetsp:Transcript_4850/g.8429  ORF Transcript_4850/g.8429 Transcript_4850/m.8429 type:complete len:252 (-) Transcript_4850:340-1095(-)
MGSVPARVRPNEGTSVRPGLIDCCDCGRLLAGVGKPDVDANLSVGGLERPKARNASVSMPLGPLLGLSSLHCLRTSRMLPTNPFMRRGPAVAEPASPSRLLMPSPSCQTPRTNSKSSSLVRLTVSVFMSIRNAPSILRSELSFFVIPKSCRKKSLSSFTPRCPLSSTGGSRRRMLANDRWLRRKANRTARPTALVVFSSIFFVVWPLPFRNAAKSTNVMKPSSSESRAWRTMLKSSAGSTRSDKRSDTRIN